MREVLFFTEQTGYPNFFSEERIHAWLDKMASEYARSIGEISFIFCSDDYILDVNRQYLQHDYYTDVITFDNSEDDVLCGDIFISLDTVRSNAELFGVSFEEEFYRVICHALLHLIGFKDKTDADAAEMRKQENSCLKLLESL
ncbi:MAG: rRNA maturation RNase YbeY [Culturomica sp.]|nr:rRNA maturation RNase YbeY [Culturomica sp.]